MKVAVAQGGAVAAKDLSARRKVVEVVPTACLRASSVRLE